MPAPKTNNTMQWRKQAAHIISRIINIHSKLQLPASLLAFHPSIFPPSHILIIIHIKANYEHHTRIPPFSQQTQKTPTIFAFPKAPSSPIRPSCRRSSIIIITQKVASDSDIKQRIKAPRWGMKDLVVAKFSIRREGNRKRMACPHSIA